MPDAMILMPRTETDDELLDAMLALLRDRCTEAADLTWRLREEFRVDRDLRLELARTIDEAMAAIDAALDDHELTIDQAAAALGVTEPLVAEADRMLAAADLKVALDPCTFDEVARSATAIMALAGVGWLEFIPGCDLHFVQFVNARSPTTLMQGLYRIVAAGYLQGRVAERTRHMERELATELGTRLRRCRTERSWHDEVISPFVSVARHVCEAMSLQWSLDQGPAALEAHARTRRGAVAEAAGSLRTQRDALGRLPDLAAFYDVGHGYGLIETLLEELADEADVQLPRNAKAPYWFDLLMDSRAGG
ncbi:MAG: hypothetical protein JWM86_785 [Thermoleophilia bacterium]|nr:hypothetical protein [Thermoleophilia bacterium]